MEGLAQLVPFVLIAVVFWLLLIRPQRKRQLAMLATQRAVTIGDEVLLGAGIVGRVVGEADDFLQLEVAPGVAMKVARGAVVRVLSPEELTTDGPTTTVDGAEATGPGATGSTAADPDPTHRTDPNDPTDPSRGH